MCSTWLGLFSQLHNTCGERSADKTADMPGHADFRKERHGQPNEQNEPEPASQTARLTDEPGIAIGNYDCGAHEAKNATGCADGRTNLRMPAVNEKNYKSREKYAAKINRSSQWSSHSFFEDAADP